MPPIVPDRRYVVGAYAASPAHQDWHPELERQYLEAVASLPQVAALELPWIDSLHPHDEGWLLQYLPRGMDVVLTDIPGTAQRCARDPDVGLASLSADGRAHALKVLATLHRDVQKLNDHLGRRAVRVIELHSAPRAARGSAGNFARSLDELSAWNWDGAALVVEHCDAEIPGQQPEKGYLTLADELEAIKQSGSRVGISLNWGRSAIELRDADRVTEHIETAARSGLLRGLMVSGASDQPSTFGPAWIDAHHPFQASPRHPLGEPTSLLTEARLTDALVAAGPLAWTGVKVGCADRSATVRQRVTMIADALDALARCQLELV
ncbi:DUF4862 family protein [Arthrobacter sp. Soc17.1.1.1]|uniref:DUF4862 family protein n=1 Tax=Arthrobacter sp. Soc17.1.1.1 TaxID=3121277 RepID=UPI002FE4663E